MRGEVLAQILDPFEGSVRSQIISPTDGVVFFAQEDPLVYANASVYKIVHM